MVHEGDIGTHDALGLLLPHALPADAAAVGAQREPSPMRPHLPSMCQVAQFTQFTQVEML